MTNPTDTDVTILRNKKGLWIEGGGIVCTTSKAILNSEGAKRQLAAWKKMRAGN